MGKITGEIVYGLKSQDKVNKILNMFWVDEHDWDSLKIEMYSSSIQDLNNILEGHSYKDFYRVDSSIFPELIKDIEQHNSNYVTYANNVIEEGMVPEKLSILIKSSTSKTKTRREVIATKVLNYFGLKTPYNVHINDKMEGAFPYIGSVDMISEDERFYSFAELEIDSLDTLYYFFNYLDSFFKYEKSQVNIKNLNIDIDKLKEEIVMTYLARQILVCDADLGSTNMGLLVNQKTKNVKFVNFDFELAFYKRTQVTDEEIRKNLEFSMINYPHAYNEFIEKAEHIQKVINEIDVPCSNQKDKDVVEFMKKRLDYIMKIHKELSQIREGIRLQEK